MESGGGPALVTGLSPVHRAMTAAALRLKSGRPLLMLCADEGEARRQAADQMCIRDSLRRYLPAGG